MKKSKDKNRDNDISGVLLTSNSHFLQILEGPYDELNETVMRIFRDTRHSELKLISFYEIESRLFKNWGMRGIGVLDLNRDLEKRLISKYGAEDTGSIRFPEKDWLALSLFFDLDMVDTLPRWE
jgi:hypothetical protein